MKAFALAILIAYPLAPGAVRAAEEPWARVGVVAVSASGLQGDRPLRFAYRDGDRLGSMLSSVGQIEPENLFLIKTEDQEDFQIALERVGRRIAALKGEGRKVFLQFYYSGHGGARKFHLKDGALDFDKVKEVLGGERADARVYVLDVCFGASFFNAKGFRTAPPVPLKLDLDQSAHGEVTISSSSLDEQAYEVKTLGGSIFTSNWIMALRGAGDRNHDGRVTLFEAYNYAYDRTAGYSAENLDRPQHPSFQVDLTGARDMTLARLLRSSTGILFHACPAGLYNVVDIQHGIQIGELHIPQGDEFTLALEPGRYRVLYRPGRGPTKAVDLDLEAAVMTRLPFEAFRVQQAVAGAPKGGSGGALERPLGEADAPAPLPENAAPAMRPARFFGRLGWGAWGGSAFFFDRTLARNLESNGPPDTYFGTTGSFSGSPYKLEFGADFTYALAGEWFLGMRLASAGMQYAMHTHGQEPLDGLSDAERAQYPVNLDWSYDFTDQRIGVFGGRAFPLAPGHSLAAEAGLSILERDAEGSRTLERTFYGTRDSDREQATRRGYRMEGALAYRHVLPFGLFGKSVIMGAKVSPYYTRFSGFHAEKSGMALDADELGCAALVTLQVLGRTAFPVTRSNAGGHL